MRISSVEAQRTAWVQLLLCSSGRVESQSGLDRALATPNCSKRHNRPDWYAKAYVILEVFFLRPSLPTRETTKLPWVQFYVFDLVEDERFVLMPKAAKGVFMDALCQEWVNDGLPNDMAAIALLTHSTKAELKKSWKFIGLFLEKRDDFRLIYPPFEIARAHAAKVAAERKRAAEVRWKPEQAA